MYPELRLHENNIIYVATIELHDMVDMLTRGHKRELYHMVLEWTAIDFIRELYHAHNAKMKDSLEEELEDNDQAWDIL